MLSQKIYNNVLTFKINELALNINIMNDSHKFLISLPMSKEVNNIYFGKKINLDKRVNAYITYVKKIQKEIKAKDLIYIKKHSNLLLKEFDDITFLYQVESENKIQEIKNVELYILVFTLFTILGIGFFILHPANKKFEEEKKR